MYPYDGTAGTHRKRLVNFRNILAISLCDPIVDTSDIRYTFSEFLTRGDTAFVHVFEFVGHKLERRLGRLSGRPRTDLNTQMTSSPFTPSDRIHGHGHRCIVTLPENCVSSRHRPSPLTLQEMLRGSRKACWMPTSSPNGKEPKEARRGCAIAIAIMEAPKPQRRSRG